MDKLPISKIDQHIAEFDVAAKTRVKDPGLYYARGVYLRSVQDALQLRLQRGWEMVGANSNTDDFWIALLDRYQGISDRLAEVEDSRRIVSHAARIIFDGAEYAE